MNNESFIEKCPYDKEIPFVMINNELLEDFSISWEAKGLLSYLIHLPKDWKVHPSHLSTLYKQRGGGEKSIYRMLNELIEAGYCRRVQEKKEDGSFCAVKYYITQFKKILPHRRVGDAVEARAVKGDYTKKEVKEIKENNNKGAAAPNPAVVVPDFIQEIGDLTDEEKISLAKYPEDRVKLALEFNKKVKPTHSKIQQLIWHCKAVIPPKPSKMNQKNNLYEYCVDFFKSNTSKRCEVEIHKDCIYFIPREGADAKPIEIRFNQEGCTEEIKKMCYHYCFMNHKKSIREK